MTTHKISLFLIIHLSLLLLAPASAADNVGIWMRYEHVFTSSKDYENPLYQVKNFTVRFTSPTGRIKNINGFWDGAKSWKVRFAPDEKGLWTWESSCTDQTNTGLHQIKSSFNAVAHSGKHAIFQRGSIIRPQGSYHLTYSDGTPFFWAGCTAWNGTLKSTEQEWETYLTNRAKNNYSVIQFVTTQWRGGDKNSLGQVAFEGSGRIKINPAFFQHLDGKINKINEHGLVAAPVLLWALATVQGRELSPGYYLPEEEAILLARYMVARYGGHQVIWILGGDGKYTGENEQRWKNIGRGVFGDEHPGLVAQHPGGGSWIGEAYASESWLDIVGYQSGHNNTEKVINGINKGSVPAMWAKLSPRPLINMEPLYEEINPRITASDVRNACYWSLLSAPVAGITYGANGIWPWLREGEEILNHSGKGEGVSRWHKSITLPGSVQIGYLVGLMKRFNWWMLKPAPDLLAVQPGEKQFSQFIAVSKTDDGNTIVAYTPTAVPILLHNANGAVYKGEWFNPVTNQFTPAKILLKNGVLEMTPPAGEGDFVVILKKK